MKKIIVLAAIIVLAFCSFSLAEGTRIKPSPSGRGTWAELGDNATFDDVTNNNLVYRETVVGAEIIENNITYTTDFQNTDGWPTVTNFVISDGTGSQIISKTSTSNVQGILQHSYFVFNGGTSQSEDFTAFVKIKSLSLDYEPFTLFSNSISPAVDTSEQYYLDTDDSQILRLNANVGLFGADLRFLGDTKTDTYAFEIFEVAVYERLPVVIKNYGDSIANEAQRETLGIPYRQSTYAMLYANQYMVEIENHATGGNTLADILADATGDLGVNKYPIVMLEGGVNDIGVSGETIADPEALATSMFNTMVQIVDLAKISSSIIPIFNCPDIPKFSASQTTTCDLYNAKLDTKYGADDYVYLFDMDSDFDANDYADDDIHVTKSGHNKIFLRVKTIMEFPRYVNQYGYVPVRDIQFSSASEAIGSLLEKGQIVSVASTTYTILRTDIGKKIWFDTDTAGAQIEVALLPGVHGDEITIYNTGSTYNVNVTPDGTELLDGVNAAKAFGEGVKVLTYHRTLGWR